MGIADLLTNPRTNESQTGDDSFNPSSIYNLVLHDRTAQASERIVDKIVLFNELLPLLFR